MQKSQSILYGRRALLLEHDDIIGADLQAKLLSMGCLEVMVAQCEAVAQAIVTVGRLEFVIVDLATAHATQFTTRLDALNIPFILSTWTDPAKLEKSSSSPVVGKTGPIHKIEVAVIKALSRTAGWKGMPVAASVKAQVTAGRSVRMSLVRGQQRKNSDGREQF